MNKNTDNLTIEQCNLLVHQANLISFDEILPELVSQILDVETRSVGTSIEFVMPALLSATGLCLQHTTIQTFENSSQGICIYTALIAHPSTGKTPASNLVKSAMTKLETFCNVSPDRSQLTNTPTVEGLLHHLNNISCMLALYDESNTFLGSLGRYSNGAAPYERSIYLTLFGAVEAMERDLKLARCKILNPRFHLSFNGHPIQVINLLRNERFSFDDGLFQRFLMSSPRPAKIFTKDIRSAPKPIISLHCIFYFIHVVHFQSKRNYTFSEQALVLIDAYFDDNKIKVEVLNEFDFFFGAMNGKSSTQVARIAVVFKALQVACTSLHGQIDVTQKDLTRDFADNVTKLALNLPADAYIIDAEVAQKAINCIDYFNLNKLILSGYDVDPTGSFQEAYLKIVSLRAHRSTLSAQFANINSNILKLMRKAFMVPYTRINASRLNSNNISVATANEVFQNLENCHLGVQQLVSSNNYHQTNYFVRISSVQLLADPALGKCIVDLGMNLQHVVRCLQETEYQESMVLTGSQQQKRVRSDNENSPPLNQAKKTKKNTTTTVRQRRDNKIPYVIKNPNVFDENARQPFANVDTNASTSQQANQQQNTTEIIPTFSINGETIGDISSINVTSNHAPENRDNSLNPNDDENDTGVSLGSESSNLKDKSKINNSSSLGVSIGSANTNLSSTIASEQSENNSKLSSENSAETDEQENEVEGDLVFRRKIDPKTGQSKRGRLSKEENDEKNRIEQINTKNRKIRLTKKDEYEFSSDTESISSRTRSRSRSLISRDAIDSQGPTNSNADFKRTRTSTQKHTTVVSVVNRKKKSSLTKTFTPRKE